MKILILLALVAAPMTGFAQTVRLLERCIEAEPLSDSAAFAEITYTQTGALTLEIGYWENGRKTVTARIPVTRVNDQTFKYRIYSNAKGTRVLKVEITRAPFFEGIYIQNSDETLLDCRSK